MPEMEPNGEAMQKRILELERKLGSLERMSRARLRQIVKQRTMLARAKVQIEMLTAQVKARELWLR